MTTFLERFDLIDFRLAPSVVLVHTSSSHDTGDVDSELLSLEGSTSRRLSSIEVMASGLAGPAEAIMRAHDRFKSLYPLNA